MTPYVFYTTPTQDGETQVLAFGNLLLILLTKYCSKI